MQVYIVRLSINTINLRYFFKDSVSINNESFLNSTKAGFSPIIIYELFFIFLK